VEEGQGQNIGSLLNALLDRLDADIQAIYRTDGLNYRPRYTPVMRVLDKHGPSSIRQISRLAPLTHSAASQTVAQMVRAGLVLSRRGADGRERVVELTSEGKSLMPRLKTHWAATSRAVRQIGEEIGAPLEEMLGRALEALSRRSLQERVAALASSTAKGTAPPA
jgi:DNA-binding MarR family transcriptional regulator